MSELQKAIGRFLGRPSGTVTVIKFDNGFRCLITEWDDGSREVALDGGGGSWGPPGREVSREEFK